MSEASFSPTSAPVVRKRFPGLGQQLRLSLVRFWGWSENKREEDMDVQELTQRAKDGKSLYGDSHQPGWIQEVAARNSTFSQLKLCMFSSVPHSCLDSDIKSQLPFLCPYSNVLIQESILTFHIQVQPRQPSSPRHRPCKIRSAGQALFRRGMNAPTL